jgi:hypothetical protein
VGSLLGAILLGAAGHPAGAAGPVDRLDRFRELARDIDPTTGGSLAEVYALLDGEIGESLESGGVFASPEFLRERVEAFAEAWGGLAVRLLPLARATAAAFSFTELPRGSTVRVYGPGGGRPGRITVLEGPGWPAVRPLPAGRGGARQFLVTWDGAPGPDGSRELRFEVVREDVDGVRVAWSSMTLFPQGLTARWHAVRGADITVRHDARYAGWTAGCDRQTAHEDVYRLPQGASAFARVSRRDVDTWHREVHGAADQVFAALARGDRAALVHLVPDRALRAQLPATLRGEAACDAAPGRDGVVSVAAVAGAHDPWTLTFRRAGGHWRLIAAVPLAP